MILPIPITFTLNFSVGVKYVVVEMNLKEGDDSEEVIMQFIQKECIPIYLETNIASCVESFLIDAIQAEKDEDDERCVLEGDVFIKQAKKWSHAFIDSNLKWNMINHAHIMTPRVERDQQAQYIGFIPAYQWIVSRPAGVSTLLKLEKSYAHAVALLRQGRESSLENLRARLSAEMDSGIKTLDPEKIPELVAKHVAEMDQAQKKWNKEIKELKRRQKTEYQDFVKDYYLSEYLLASVNNSIHSELLPDTPTLAPTPTPAPATPSVPSDPQPHHPVSASISSSSSGSFPKFPINIQSNAKKIFNNFPSFGKSKSEAPLEISAPPSTQQHDSHPHTPPHHSSSSSLPLQSSSSSLSPILPSSPSPSPLYNNDPLHFLNKEGRGISPNLFFHETIPVHLGRQRKNLFYFKLFTGELIEFCLAKELHKGEKEAADGEEEEGSTRFKQRKKMATSLYGNCLSGLVLLVTPDLSYKSDTCKEFINICGSSTEFHFETFKEQLAKVKSANPRLNSGDFFITKHSNLLHVNVVFHLVVDSADASLQAETATFSLDSNAALGLRNIVLTASQCDIQSLVIPAALSEPGLESMVASETALKSRLDIVTKTVRLALTSVGESGSLKTVQFVVREPPHTSDQPLYKKLKGLLTATNKAQQPAYKV